METNRPELDQLITETVEAIRELERLLLETAKAMTRVAAGLSALGPLLEQDKPGDASNSET